MKLYTPRAKFSCMYSRCTGYNIYPTVFPRYNRGLPYAGRIQHKIERRGGDHRVPHTEWQRPLSGVQSIMMEKLAQAGKGGGLHACPSPFTISTITYKVAVYAPAEMADTLPLFLLYPYMYSVGAIAIMKYYLMGRVEKGDV